MNNKIREEKCIMCEEGTVSFFVMEDNNKEFIGGACDSCGFCCGDKQVKGNF